MPTDNNGGNGGGANNDGNNGGGGNDGGNQNLNNNQNNGGQGGGNGTGGNNDGNQNQNQNNGNVQLNEEQLAAAFNHPRFKELTAAANELKTLKQKQADDEAARLTEQGEFKTLAEKAQQEAKDAKTQLQGERINNALFAEASKLGAHDPTVVAKLVESGKVTIDDNGVVTGAEAALKELQTANPYLFKTGNQTKIGGGDTNGGASGDADFTFSQFQDGAYYKEHAKEMDAAMASGRVDMTR